MRKLLLFIIMAVTLSGCGLFKRVSTYIESHRKDSLEKINTVGTKTDKSKIVITEKIDTAIKVPGYSQAGEWKINNDSEGKKFPGFQTPSITLDSTLTTVKLTYDSLTNSVKVLVTAKDQLVKAIQEKRTEIFNDIREDTKSKKEVKVKTQDKVKDKQSKPDYWWIAWVIGVGCVGYFVWTQILKRRIF